MKNWFKYEEAALLRGYRVVCGVDEAGRGPLAGDVLAAAVILPYGIEIPNLRDSKMLTQKCREDLYEIITAQALSYAVARASVEEIEEINILNATLLAMRRAIEALRIRPDYLLIDGNIFKGFDIPGQAVIGGDDLSLSIAAASVLAKVSRDRYMLQMAEKYPGYCFEKHKGYGTKAHYQAIDLMGICEIHRRGFLKGRVAV
jgi:ribonuclease HII